MVSDRNLSTDMWTAIRASIVAVAPTITDGTSTKTASIVASYNDNNPSKPQIVIYPVKPSESKDKFSTDFGRYDISVSIDCRYSSSLGIDQLRDQVSYALSTTYIPDVELQTIESDPGFAEEGEQKYHINAMSIVYSKE